MSQYAGAFDEIWTYEDRHPHVAVTAGRLKVWMPIKCRDALYRDVQARSITLEQGLREHVELAFRDIVF